MKYSEFERAIHRMVASASVASRRSFALDTIRRLQASTADAVETEFTESERSLLCELVSETEDRPAEFLKLKLERLVGSLNQDEIRAIEFRPDVTEFLCAIDHWIEYLRTHDHENVAHIAINMVNAVDYASDSDYSVENMLGAPAMVAEYQRQQRMLTASDPVTDVYSARPS